LSEEDYDTEFTMPDLDDPPLTEAGVILMGLPADRLLAGLGLASIADDPVQVTLVVDQATHGALDTIDAETLVDAGVARWQTARVALAAVGRSKSGASARRQWASAMEVLAQAEIGEVSPASLAYLGACWLRRGEIDRVMEERRVSEVAT
jgi:hypothetical protein